MINTFSNIAGYKINSKKLASLINTNNELSEKEIRETTPFIIASNIIKHLEETNEASGRLV